MNMITVDQNTLMRMIAQAVEAEREACAKVCGKLADEALAVGDENAVLCFEEVENAIRARKTT